MKGNECRADCYCNNLKHLDNLPKGLETLVCSSNKLTSLKGSPKEVGGHFICYNNKLTSFEGGPTYVGRDFNCSNNPLTSLKGIPKYIGGNFYTNIKINGREITKEDIIAAGCDLKGEVIGEVIGDDAW